MAKKPQHPNSMKNLDKGGWKENQSGNPAGRPKRVINAVIEEVFGKDGKNKVTKQEVAETMFALLLNTEKQLEEKATHSESLMLVKVLSQKLLDPDFAYTAVRDTLDRLFGKPTTTQVIAGDAERPLTPTPIVFNTIVSGLPPGHNHIENGADE